MKRYKKVQSNNGFRCLDTEKKRFVKTSLCKENQTKEETMDKREKFKKKIEEKLRKVLKDFKLRFSLIQQKNNKIQIYLDVDFIVPEKDLTKDLCIIAEKIGFGCSGSGGFYYLNQVEVKDLKKELIGLEGMVDMLVLEVEKSYDEYLKNEMYIQKILEELS